MQVKCWAHGRNTVGRLRPSETLSALTLYASMHQTQRNAMLSPLSAVLEAAMNFTGTESLIWKVS